MLNTDQEYLAFYQDNKMQKKIDTLAKKYNNDKVIIYGVGKAFDVLYENYDLSGLTIVGVADIKFKNGEDYKGIPTYDAYTFMDQKPDIVIIGALGVERILDFFEEELFPKYGKFKVDAILDVSIWQLLKLLIK